MSFRFWRRVRLAPGVTLNLSKSNASLSDEALALHDRSAWSEWVHDADDQQCIKLSTFDVIRRDLPLIFFLHFRLGWVSLIEQMVVAPPLIFWGKGRKPTPGRASRE